MTARFSPYNHISFFITAI